MTEVGDRIMTTIRFDDDHFTQGPAIVTEVDGGLARLEMRAAGILLHTQWVRLTSIKEGECIYDIR